MIDNEPGLEFSVRKTTPVVVTDKGRIPQSEEIMFLIECIKPKRDLTASGDLVISLDKDEAKELVKVLIDLI